MNKLDSSHTPITPPPQRLLPAIEKTKAAYKKWLPVHRNMPRTERFGIGERIDALFLDVLESLRQAMYAPMHGKMVLLEQASIHIDSLRFFVQLSWEVHLISPGQFTALGSDIEELGKMVGGWRKGLLSKTPAGQAGERA